jgi:hypothetical protein
MKITNKMQLYKLIYYFKSALHVLGDVFAHHHEHLSVFTVSASVHPSCCRHQPQYPAPDNVHQLHVQQPYMYEKPEAASAVLGS